MKFQIDMLDVGNADCFILQYFKSDGSSRLIMVDGGNYTNGEEILEHLKYYYTGQSIDLAIVTHPDKDHFGGFIYLLEQMANDPYNSVSIEKFIVNDPGNVVEADDFKWKRSNQKTQEDARSVFDIDEHGNLLEIIDNLSIPREEWYAKSFNPQSIDPYLLILGPSEKYYKEKVLEFRHGLEPIKEEKTGMFSKADFGKRDIDKENPDPSSHNASSLIFLFLPEGENGNKYLFTGDATRESFDKILYKSKLKDCYWMKIPHHGSIHNLNTYIIEKINPSKAFISAKGNDSHPAEEIIEKLKENGCKVFSTHSHGKIHHYSKGIGRRPGWKEAKSL